MVQRLRTFLREVVGRLRALVQEIGRRDALAGAIVLLALSLLALSLTIVFAVLSSRQHLAEQALRGEGITVAPESRPEDFPLIFGSEPSSEPREAASADGSPREIPGLSEMDIIGNLRDVPSTDFRCPGGSRKRTCTSSSEEEDAVYEVTVAKDGAAVTSVVVEARDASDEAAVEVLGEVARLAVGGLGPADPKAWVDRTIFSGGQYLAEGAEVRLYGTEGARTLEIVGTGLPAQEPRNEGTSPKTDQGGR